MYNNIDIYKKGGGYMKKSVRARTVNVLVGADFS